jgi:glycosyltransferase involved in cell wall biosynthesis
VHVGLNLVFLVPDEQGGLEIYARELLRALAGERSGVRFTSFVNRDLRDAPGEWTQLGDVVEVPVSARRRVEWVRGEQLLLPGLAWRAGVDLVHSLASTAPARGRFRRVVTIHDLHYRVAPDAHFGIRGLGMRVLVPLAARRSDRVIASSSSTGADVRRHLRVPAARIDVVPLGFGHSPVAVAEAEAVLRERHALGGRQVVLTVSAKRPHKNLARLLEALAAIPAERRPALVMPGYPTPYERELRAHADALGLRDDVRFLGWVGDAELEGLYDLAALSVFPSLHEGFGLPVLEAMNRGLPVACSDSPSLSEVSGDAALLFDPHDSAAIARAIERLLGDRAEAARLVEAGRAQAARFTWAATARGTLASYERALGSSPTSAPP